MRILHKLTLWLFIFSVPVAICAQNVSLVLPLVQKQFKATQYGRIKTGVLCSNVNNFKFNSQGYLCYGVSSFEIKYYNYTLKHKKLNIFIGVKAGSLETCMIPDLNFDNNFNNDTLLAFDNTTGFSIDSINNLSAVQQPFKLPMPVENTVNANGKNYIYIRLTPRTYFSYSKKHPPANKSDSLYVNAEVCEHYEAGFTYKKDTFKVLVQDASLDTVANTIGIGNTRSALAKITMLTDKTEAMPLFMPLNTEQLSYGNYVFNIKVVGEYSRVGITINKNTRCPATGILPGMDAIPFYAYDVLTQKKYNFIDKQKCTLLFFWFVGCGPCHDVMPELNLFEQKKRSQVSILSICTAGRKDEITADINKFKISYPVLNSYTGSKKDIAQLYKIQAYPTFVLISADGKVLCRSSTFSDIANWLNVN